MMTTNNTLSKVLMFTAGAVIGSVVTWKLVKTKYEQLAQKDIEEVRAYYDEKYNEKSKTEETEEELEEPDERAEYEDFVQNTGYANHSDEREYEYENEEEGDDMAKPYVIPPEEFDENGYETMSLRYYSNGVLVDEAGEVVDDLDGTVGADFATHFGEYEDDSVFVRNDDMKVDFEILRDEGSYPENS